MDALMKADIFFFVATIVVIFVGLFLLVALFYFLRILSDLRYISKTARKEGVAFVHDFRSALNKLVKDLPKLINIIGVAKALHSASKTRKRRKSK